MINNLKISLPYSPQFAFMSSYVTPSIPGDFSFEHELNDFSTSALENRSTGSPSHIITGFSFGIKLSEFNCS